MCVSVSRNLGKSIKVKCATGTSISDVVHIFLTVNSKINLKD